MHQLQERLQSTIQLSLAQQQIPGATIAIHRYGGILLKAGIGYQDSDRAIPLPGDAQFYIYSVTKTLIAAAVLHLVHAGQLDLDTPAQTYGTNLPLLPSITLRHLLNHTSGLPDYGGLSSYSAAVRDTPTSPWTEGQFLNLIQTLGLRFSPGQGWAYSNLGYLVLKLILENTTGAMLQTLLDALFFRPLSLQKTFVPMTLADVAGLTPGYKEELGDCTLQNMAHLYHPAWVSHGVVVSTASELAILIHALFQGDILDPSLITQMTQPAHIVGKHPPFEEAAYGLGLMIDTASPYGPVWGHAGGGPGYSIAAFHFPRLAGSATTITALVNRDRGGYGTELVYQVAQAIAAPSIGEQPS
jgi:D-alanyl-D-alanine carboxypeptidase